MRAIGQHYEDRAANWLRERGWQILQRNVSYRQGELDIVALDDHCLIFVEVKARSGSSFSGALGAVTAAKRKRLILAANSYLQDHPQHRHRRCRFDLITFEPRQSQAELELTWIPGAFSADPA